MGKIGRWASGIVVGIAVLAVLQRPDGKVHIVFCDVGQGDAVLIHKGSMQVLIDGGPSPGKVLACLQEEVPFWDRRLEAVVLTNTDYDHINGVIEVLARYEVPMLATADGVGESGAVRRFAEALGETRLEPVEAGDEIRVGELTLTVLWPDETNEERVLGMANASGTASQWQSDAKTVDVNERSVVIRFSYQGKTALLTGDIGSEIEETIAALAGDIDLLKVAHHGSKHSTSAEFLLATRPELAVISVGADNNYGHPTQDVLDRLAAAGAGVHRTDREGKVEVVWE